MDTFVINGPTPLSGEVRLSGAKNSVLKLIAAALLVEGDTTLYNVPAISDVETMTGLIQLVGASVARPGENTLVISVGNDLNTDLAVREAEKIRASIVAMGPLLARRGHARLAIPGGDDLGGRPIDLHLDGFRAMGAQIVEGTTDDGVHWVEAYADKLTGANIKLPFPSVGATENILMAAVCAAGTTIIDNAAREPEIADLATMLIHMGAQITGAGSSEIRVEGVSVESLIPVRHTVIPDRIEAATFLAAVACAGGEINIVNARADHLTMLISTFGSMNLRVSATNDGLWVSAPTNKRLRACDVATLPYPGVATDYKPFIVTTLATADGTSIVTENLFADRFKYFDELVAMGADISVDAHHAIIRGVAQLHGATVVSHDIRGGAALIVGALGAQGQTVVTEAHHVLRGYADLDGRLRALGADVTVA
jgi:UDP-N-acetylglucosamine 1-carboxyvinyltransferase